MQPAHHRNKMPRTGTRQRGIALLIMLSIIIIALTTIAIARLSLNDSIQKRKAMDLRLLSETQYAIMAWAYIQDTAARPPGTLPCPDINNDGMSDRAGSNCMGSLGFVPFVDLNIPRPLDSEQLPLWYAIDITYGNDVNPAVNNFRNSSLTSSLWLDINIPTNQQAFILIISGDALNGQTRGVISPTNRAQFLEGLNADTNLNSYSSLSDDDHNDVVFSTSVDTYWKVFEQRAVRELAKLLTDYRNACTYYPDAAVFTSNNALPNNLSEGRAPLVTAQPTNWGTGCAPALPNNWLIHWSRVLYYAHCNPGVNCLSLRDANNQLVQMAPALLMAPGNVLAGQNRTGAAPAINNFFENQNASPGDNIFQFTLPGAHTATFNDEITILP